MQEQFNTIRYEVAQRVGVITLARAESRNAQNKQLLNELDKAWTLAAEDENVRVILLRAEGPHFSAGHDLKESWFSTEESLWDAYLFEKSVFLDMKRRWRDVPKPSIAAVNGWCIAAGLMLAWPCDLIVAADDARFSDPVVHLGVAGVEYHGHTAEFGARKAKEMLFTGRSISAQEAKELGMVNQVVPPAELAAFSMDLAKEIAEKDRFTLMQIKRAVNLSLDIAGQDAAYQAMFDIHWLSHANVLAMTKGESLEMTDLDGLRKARERELAQIRGSEA